MNSLLRLVCVMLFLIPAILKAESKGDTIEYQIQGKITYKSGTVVRMQKLSGDEMPALAQEGELSKRFETELFGGKMTGWISIGDMKVTAVDEDIVTFSLLKELSVVTENGVKKNHFVIGKEVKFVWKKAVTADEVAYKMGQDAEATDVSEAMRYYKEAVRLNPQNDKALNMIGTLMSEQESRDSALIYFKKAFEIAPKNIQYAKNLSITSFKTGHGQDGYDYAKKAVECDILDPEAWYLRGLMYYLLKKSSLTEEDKKIVMADMDKAVQLTPEESFYLGERAFLRKEFGNGAGACEDAKKARELGAENGDELIKEYCSQ
jgi:hypothetical protein